MAAMVPISRMRSNTDMSMTLSTLMSTMAIMTIFTVMINRSIMLAMLAKGDRSAQVWISNAGLPLGFLNWPSALASCPAVRSRPSIAACLTTISVTSPFPVRSRDLASSMCM